MGAAFSKPKMPKVEDPPPPPDENAAALGTARADALRTLRQRSSLLQTATNGTQGVMGKPRTASAGLLGR